MRKLTLLLMTLLLLNSCQKEETIVVETVDKEVNLLNEDFYKFTYQFYGTTRNDSLNLLEVDTILNEPSETLQGLIDEFGLQNPYNIQADFGKKEGIINFNSITMKFTDDGEVYISVVSITNEDGKEFLATMYFERSPIGFIITDFYYTVDKYNWKRYGECVGNILSTDELIGSGIAVLGVAGGMGCVGCGIAAGFLLGVGALACI